MMPWTTDDLLPNLIQNLRKRTKPLISVVAPDGGLAHLSVENVHNASNRAAWFLSRNLEASDGRFFYMGPNDVRYLIWVVGAMKTRKCVIFPSPSNTVQSNKRLFAEVGATKLLYAPESCTPFAPLLRSTATTMISIPTPSYSELMDSEVVDEFSFPHAFGDLRNTPVLGLHSSGSSGHPKVIYWNHAAICSIAIHFDFSTLPNPSKRPHLFQELSQGNNLFLSFAMCHVGGIVTIMRCFLADCTVVLPSPGTRLSTENIAKMLEVSSSTTAIFPPSILEAMLNSPRELESICKLKHVAYSGGPLNPVLGQKLAEVVQHFFPIYGCTEGGGPYLESTGDNTYWGGMKFFDLGHRMEEVFPGLYELVITRTDLVNRTQAYFHTCPQLEVFRTSDLFVPIEGSDGWWKFHGRTDNWITMSNGLKMDPTEMENVISAHPDVTGVVMAGSRRFRLCLLVELKLELAPKSEEERKRVLDELWPMIEEANKGSPKFGRVLKELIFFPPPQKPFARATKGTIQRMPTIDSYEEETEDLYAKLGDGLLAAGLLPLKSTNAEAFLLFLKNICTETLETDEITADDDLFAKGLDSLSIFVLVARIKAGLCKHNVEENVLKRVDNALIFTSTTIRILAQKLSLLLSEPGGVGPDTQGDNMDDIRYLVTKYEAKITTTLRDGGQTGHIIVLTGSGGSLGSYILAALLARRDVKKVYCLNRGGDLLSKQISSFRAKGLPDSHLQRARFLQADFAEPNLGLSDDDYAGLKADTTIIIHNAYPVNFLMPVRSFEAQIQGLLNILKLAQDGIRNPATMLISSIAAAFPVSGSHNIVSETVLDLEEVSSTAQQGYGQSKFICEKLVEKYVSASTAKGAILRIGQVTGPLQGLGVWNAREWVPSLICSSKYLGVVPESIGTATMEWIPVDLLGQIVSELIDDVARRAGGNVIVYNVLNPEATSWSEVLRAVKQVVPKTVSPAEWIAKLEKSRDAGTHVLDQNPGLKLVEFYKEVFLSGSRDRPNPVQVEKQNLLQGSKTARELSSIKAEHFAKWMRGWGL